MTITAAGLAGGNFADNTTAVTLSVGSVSAGQLVVVQGMKFSPSADAYVAGDCTQTAGTATLGSFTLDRNDGGTTGTGSFAYTGVWSAIVTGSGTLTVQVGGAVAGSFLLCSAEVFNGSWDASRVDGTGNGALDAGDTISALSTGTSTSTGAGLFVSCLAVNDSVAQNVTKDAAFTAIYTQNDGVNHAIGGSAYRIVSSSTTAACSWTFNALNGGAGNGAAASLIIYKEAAASSIVEDDSGWSLNGRQPSPIVVSLYG